MINVTLTLIFISGGIASDQCNESQESQPFELFTPTKQRRHIQYQGDTRWVSNVILTEPEKNACLTLKGFYLHLKVSLAGWSCNGSFTWTEFSMCKVFFHLSSLY